MIILYGDYEENASFIVAAETQYQKALDAGYEEEDILITKVSKDSDFLQQLRAVMLVKLNIFMCFLMAGEKIVMEP